MIFLTIRVESQIKGISFFNQRKKFFTEGMQFEDWYKTEELHSSFSRSLAREIYISDHQVYSQ